MKVMYILHYFNNQRGIGFYPPYGTIGDVVEQDDGDDSARIQWPIGTTKEHGCWWAAKSDLITYLIDE